MPTTSSGNWLARSKTTSQWSGALFGVGAAAFVDEVVFHQYVPVGTHHLCIPDAAAVGCRRLSRLLRSKAGAYSPSLRSPQL